MCSYSSYMHAEDTEHVCSYSSYMHAMHTQTYTRARAISLSSLPRAGDATDARRETLSSLPLLPLIACLSWAGYLFSRIDRGLAIYSRGLA